MSEEKRTRVRAIILQDEKIISMYREKDNRVFYTFPGGGLEGNESEIDCVKREVFEEFGMVVEPVKKVYIYENERSIEHFYICEHISGDFGTGEGEEYDKNQTNGLYRPTMINIKDITNLPLMPPEVAQAFYDDYNKKGKELRNKVKLLYQKSTRLKI